jgi:hypothetical protein
MSRTSPEPAPPPASRSWFAISPGFHADDPGTIALGISGRAAHAREALPLPADLQTSARGNGFHAGIRWDTHDVTGILILSAVLALGGVVVWIVLLLWAAREDGRDQERRDQLRDH